MNTPNGWTVDSYGGVMIKDVPTDYLVWAAVNAMSPGTRYAASAEVSRRVFKLSTSHKEAV